MKILITGNLGYVGPSVTRQLRARYPEAVLIGVDIGFFAHCLTNVSRVPETLLDTQHFCDIRRVSDELLSGVDAVVHLAAISNDPMGSAYEEATLDVNYRAAVELGRRAKAAGVRAFVFASSCSVYGYADDGPRTERSHVDPLTPYARSKVLAEEGLGELAAADFRVTCLRFATACGMSDRLRLDLVLNDFVASAVLARRITVLSDGSPWRPLINVTDMARAIEWAVGADADAAGDFLVVNAGSSAWNYQVHSLANAVASVVDGTEISINRDAPPDRRSYRVDFSMFEALAPRHQPLSDLIGTIEQLREGVEQIRFASPNFRDSAYVRLRVLGELQALGLLSRTLEWTDKRAALATTVTPLQVS